MSICTESRAAIFSLFVGPVLPFQQVEQAERWHAGRLEGLLASHGAAIPGAPPVSMPAAPSIAAACAVAVDVEKKNIALYEALLAKDLPPDVRCTFQHLAGASRERHLPAFERCAGASR
jgi:hypothetical protein